ncbi:hypothetical protein CY34DRAFT_722844 [Suillus luteus UH-Slu-Lm8-n1]|uniref:Uncharacterized protein n=1 Tax=Suillus luteus UH-Slu-Lm8-n1 TaxID=930992 RepID=A0A0D0AG74_9AGAM|nr:hypothetical protein CY34DRAFT_722844 [Suillus luteus UH-Slu-Lm8-n1]
MSRSQRWQILVLVRAMCLIIVSKFSVLVFLVVFGGLWDRVICRLREGGARSCESGHPPWLGSTSYWECRLRVLGHSHGVRMMVGKVHRRYHHRRDKVRVPSGWNS